MPNNPSTDPETSKFDMSQRMGRSAVALMAGTSPAPWDLGAQHEYMTEVLDANNSLVCVCKSAPNSHKNWNVHGNDAYLIAGAHEMRQLLIEMKSLGNEVEVEAWLFRRDRLLAWIDGEIVKPESFQNTPEFTGPVS